MAKIEIDILNLKTKIQKLSTLAGSEHILPSLNQTLASNQLALQIIKNRAETKKIISLNNQKGTLSKPIRGHKLAPLDPARKKALTQLREKIKLSNLTPIETLELKKEVIHLMADKDLQKSLPWFTPKWYKPSENRGQAYSNPDIFNGGVRRPEASRFHHRLNKLKRNLNIHLYPTYGKHINALEDYITALKLEGVTKEDKRKVKTIIFKSDRTQKLNIAEKLKKELINFEAKTQVEKEANPNITVTVEAIKKLIEQNQKATGSVYLHGKGKLDKILKDLKEKIKDPAWPRPTSDTVRRNKN